MLWNQIIKLAISHLLYLWKEKKEDLLAAFLTWWGSVEKLLQERTLKSHLQENANKIPVPSEPESAHTHTALWDKDCVVYCSSNAQLLNHTVPLCERTQSKWLRLLPLYSLSWKAVIASGPEPGTERAPHQCMVVRSRLLCVNTEKDKPQDKVRALKFLFVTSRYHEFDINRQDQWMSSSTLHSHLILQSTKNGARFTS